MKLTKATLKRIIKEELQATLGESVGSYGGDPITTITTYIEDMHDSGMGAMDVWNKIAQLDRKANSSRQTRISAHNTTTPVANLIKPENERALWSFWEKGEFEKYRDAIRSRLKVAEGEQWLQSLADEISLEFGRKSMMKDY